MEVTPVSKGNKYEILPRVGQVWAIYKNWGCAGALKILKGVDMILWRS
jgi:hypothetical protein